MRRRDSLPGKTSYNWETYVMIDFSSGSGVSTSGKGSLLV